MKKIIILLLLPMALTAQKNYPKLLDAYVQAEFKVKEFNGTVLVMQKGKAMYEKSFGLADREWNVANTNETKYRIGSVTKQFTAACILQLAEQGKLNLDDKLSKYIPDYPKGDSITTHMLLNHTSGIKNYTDLPEFWPKAILPLSTDSMIALFKNKPLDFSPGTNWNYSNSGYFLLGVIVEKVSGKKLNYAIGARRPGDVIAIYANNNLAKTELKWTPEYSLDDMMLSAWKWQMNLDTEK